MKAFSVMTTNLVAAREGTTAREIGAKLLIGNFNGLPVIDSNIKVIGIVTAVDILRSIRQGKNLDSIRAIDIMTRNPMVVKQDTEINEIIDIILQKAIILVPVINDERSLIGVVGRLDILRQNLNEKFVTIGGRNGESAPATSFNPKRA
ncbi:MAG: CBS domain-containing protein [Candidatus Nitrosopolaris sp.]